MTARSTSENVKRRRFRSAGRDVAVIGRGTLYINDADLASAFRYPKRARSKPQNGVNKEAGVVKPRLSLDAIQARVSL